MRRTVRGGSALLAAGILFIGLGACGDDDDDQADAGDEASDGDLAADGSSDTTEFCDAALAVDAVSLGLESGEATPDDFEQALQAAEDSAPDELAGAIGTMVTEALATMEAPETEDGPPPMPGEAFYPASVEVAGLLGDNCDVETLDVTATNYTFAGIGETVPAGTTVINLTNDGTEFHEVLLFQLADGEERPLEELMPLPDDEVDSQITEKEFVLRAAPAPRPTRRLISIPAATWRSASCQSVPPPRPCSREPPSTRRTGTSCTAWSPSSRSPDLGQRRRARRRARGPASQHPIDDNEVGAALPSGALLVRACSD